MHEWRNSCRWSLLVVWQERAFVKVKKTTLSENCNICGNKTCVTFYISSNLVAQQLYWHQLCRSDKYANWNLWKLLVLFSHNLVCLIIYFSTTKSFLWCFLPTSKLQTIWTVKLQSKNSTFLCPYKFLYKEEKKLTNKKLCWSRAR